MPVVEPILALFQVQVEGRRRDAVELLEPPLSETPKALNAVDVMRALHKLVLTMMNSKMLGVSNINQTIITTPSIGVDDSIKRAATAHNGLQSALFALRHNLGVDAAISLEDAEDDSLAAGSATTLATHAPRAEVRLIHFDLARCKGGCAFAFFPNALSDFEKDRGDTLACQTSEFG